MKKLIYTSAFALVLVLAFIVGQNTVQKVGAQNRVNSIYKTSTSTTSPAYMTNGTGTTTVEFSSSMFDAIAVNMRYFASTTSNRNNTPILQIERQASNNGIDWFTYNEWIDLTNNTATTSRGVASTTVPIHWQPNVMGATTTKALTFDLLPALFTRLIFSLATTTPQGAFVDGGNLWVEVLGSTSI